MELDVLVRDGGVGRGRVARPAYTKVCCHCHERRAPQDFGRDRSRPDGLACRCRTCEHERYLRNRQDKLPHMYDYYRRNRAHYLTYFQGWKQRRPDYSREYKRRGKHTAKHRARVALEMAVAAGRVEKPDRCSDCGTLTSASRLHGHHADYGKPYEVEWMCPRCHGLRHRFSWLRNRALKEKAAAVETTA